ncbi:hypothetical protein HOY82DRAFT_625562 [Tuber indicum]|nr:hypothetical protein HOY82DRAFT_625562 [Tuber indicum]
MKIGDGKKLKSKLVAIMDPYGDGVRAIVKNKTCAFLKARKRRMNEAKKVTRLQKELEVRGRHAEVLTRHEEEKEWKLQEKAMAKKEARVMDEKLVLMYREGNGTEQREMQIAKTD